VASADRQQQSRACDQEQCGFHQRAFPPIM
jgi:hypothetical protein